ncbi:MAG: DSBA oxidoreductase family protein [Candidatus Magasanikbacteria bacterium GW2011_GWD2_43_18]|uniref:DSBA oxidoreductase family protein n=1 Tax=Candidatus Magasanikbacteria bacterium GW2011_GWE2_42_7 TaxID=1619052 RepID=A0A0G1EDX5_9BACT|nr:MAG: DSBA oxidoreductase family protein [Candidatus Magasanikbacteria bacterium GW2011_GWC2_42_27]KKS72718.1 MAG: DSBA oxidoreductase family protein [Candidatus Magasanikbacteria bacterium GW2011_GWE2_42_7]KKT05046.1 MAG: DSBA oxidoreductase family protein [Candidatus Magasanikbacteria bacterium GW2011_GWD2_43_18]KKT24764.1 MAG: DSBA oxidoreductase family protein [Candidatus Magasanikbacteria bacterium GW2011_GWA2_43_9]
MGGLYAIPLFLSRDMWYTDYNSMHDQQFPEKSWYKTGGGIVFLGILSILVALLIAFFSFVAYYIYQIRTGNASAIEQTLQQAAPNFSFLSTKTKDTPTQQLQETTPFIRSFNPQIGDPSNPVTLLAFIDFECPYCQEAYPAFQQMMEKYDSAIHVVFKQFPLTTIHAQAMAAAVASTCAQEQDMFWEYYESVFTSRDLSDEGLLLAATRTGLTESIFTSCIDSDRYAHNITQDIQDGIDLDVRGTPTYIVNGKKIEGVLTADMWDTIMIDAIQSR